MLTNKRIDINKLLTKQSTYIFLLQIIHLKNSNKEILFESYICFELNNMDL